MKIAVIDDYQNAFRTLRCYAKLKGHEVMVYNDTEKDQARLVVATPHLGYVERDNGVAGEPWPAGPSVPSAGSAAAGGRNQRGSPATPFARPSAVGRTMSSTTESSSIRFSRTRLAIPSTCSIPKRSGRSKGAQVDVTFAQLCNFCRERAADHGRSLNCALATKAGARAACFQPTPLCAALSQFPSNFFILSITAGG
jgi:hypothetical protein